MIEFQLIAQALHPNCTVNYLEVTTSEDTQQLCPDDMTKLYRYHTTTDDVTVKYVTIAYNAAHTFSLNYRG